MVDRLHMSRVSQCRFLALTTALLLTGTPCLAAGTEGEKIILQDGYAFIDTTINGRGPFRLLLDTGTTSCLLTPAAAKRAALRYDHRSELATLTGQKVVPGSWHNEVRLGGNVESDIEFLVSPLPRFPDSYFKVDGILGSNFLHRTSYLIDYRLKRLWLNEEAHSRAASLPIAVEGIGREGLMILPVVLEPGSRPWHLTLDSGTTNLVIACAERCPKASEVREGNQLHSAVGHSTASRAKLNHLEVGSIRMSHVDAVLVETGVVSPVRSGALPMSWFSAVFSDGNTVRLRRGR